MERIRQKTNKLFSSKIVMIGLSFILGLVLGYYLGLCDALHIMKDTLSQIHIDFSWTKGLGEISPNVSFLSDVAAFEAAVIAFLVPLSIEIVSKLSERYQSDVIIRAFEDSIENKYLPLILIINIIIAIVLRFFINDDTDDCLLWKIIAWLILVGFVFIACAILKIIRRIKVFMSDTQAVIDQLYKGIESAFEE